MEYFVAGDSKKTDFEWRFHNCQKRRDKYERAEIMPLQWLCFNRLNVDNFSSGFVLLLFLQSLRTAHLQPHHRPDAKRIHKSS